MCQDTQFEVNKPIGRRLFYNYFDKLNNNRSLSIFKKRISILFLYFNISHRANKLTFNKTLHS